MMSIEPLLFPPRGLPVSGETNDSLPFVINLTSLAVLMASLNHITDVSAGKSITQPILCVAFSSAPSAQIALDYCMAGLATHSLECQALRQTMAFSACPAQS